MFTDLPPIPEYDTVLTAAEFDAVRRDRCHSGAWVEVNVLDNCLGDDGFVFTVVAADGKWSTPPLRCVLKEQVQLSLEAILQCENFVLDLKGAEVKLLLKPGEPSDEHDGLEVIGIDPFWIEQFKRVKVRDSLRTMASIGNLTNQHDLPDPVKIKRIGIVWDRGDPNFEEINRGLVSIVPEDSLLVPIDADFSEEDGLGTPVCSHYRRLIKFHITKDPIDVILILHSGASPTFRMMGSALANDIANTDVPVIVGMPRGRNRSLIHQVAFDAGDSVGEALVLLQQLLGVPAENAAVGNGVRH